MKRAGLMLGLMLMACGPKKAPVTVPVSTVDTLTIAGLGNIQDLLLPDGEDLLARRLANSPDVPSFTIAGFVPLDGLTGKWYGRLGLGQFLNQVYAGALLVPSGFLLTEGTERKFAVLDPCGGSLVRTYRFGRVGFIASAGAGVSDSAYFRYRKSLSILKARSDFVVEFSERPDLVSDTLVNFSLAGEPRVTRLVVSDRKIRSIEDANFEIVRALPDPQIAAEVADFRSRLSALRAETLFVHESNDAAFKKYIGRQVQEYFQADLVILSGMIFTEPLERGRRVFTIDTLARYVVGNVLLAKRQCSGAEAKAAAKRPGTIVVGSTRKETALVQTADVGTSLFDILIELANRR